LAGSYARRAWRGRRGDGPDGSQQRGTRRLFQLRGAVVKWIPLILFGLSSLWILGDLGYSVYVGRRLAEREASIERDDEGVEIGCRGFTIGEGDTALLMIHGINSSPACFHKMAPALADAGFTCRAMRLPGFAEPIDRYAAATKEQWLAAARREAEALRGNHRRVVAISHSLGSAVAIALALDSPETFDAHVLLAPAIEVSNRRSPILSTRAWHRFARHTLCFTTVTYSPFEDACRDPEGQDYPGHTLFTPQAVVDETFQLLDANRGRAAELEAPLLVFLTKDDRVVDWRAAERFYDRAGSTPKAISFLGNSGHAIPVDYPWEQVTSEIVRFLRALESADAPDPAAP
jgi:carboxylesterase